MGIACLEVDGGYWGTPLPRTVFCSDLHMVSRMASPPARIIRGAMADVACQFRDAHRIALLDVEAQSYALRNR